MRSTSARSGSSTGWPADERGCLRHAGLLDSQGSEEELLMRRRTAMFLALAAAAAVGTLTVWYARSSPGAAGQAPPRFVPGVEYRYALTWRSTQRGVVGAKSDAAPALLGEIDVAATLVLRGVRDDGVRSLVEARLEPGSRYAMTV